MQLALSSTSGPLMGAGMGADRIEDIYTLSPLQQGMLFHILSAPDSRLYLDQTLCTLDGRLEVEPFQRAWQTVVDRHPGLRTAFLWEGLSKPVQVVYRGVALPVEQLDWRHLSSSVQRSQLEAFLHQDRQRAFDLTRPPLTRLYLIRMSEDSYQLVWSVYHLVVDAWCSSIILNEVVALYEAYRRGEDAHLEPPPPYREYISWLRRQDLAEAEAFWRQYLQGYNQPCFLARDDFSGTWPGGNTGFRHEQTCLSEVDTVALRSRGREFQLTLNTLVQGAWALLVAHRTGAGDVVFGSAVSGRPPSLPGVESIVGLFINTLPHRVRVSRSAALIPWFKQLQARQVEMRQYEFTPLSKIQGWSEIPAGIPLFESNVVFLNVVDLARQDTGSLAVQNVRYVGRPHYALNLHVNPGSQLGLEMVYDACKFRQSSVHEILHQLKALLQVFVLRPESTVDEIMALLARSDEEKKAEETRKRRDSNTGKLRLTRPIRVRVPGTP